MRLLVSYLLFLLTISCTRNQLAPQAYLNFYQDNIDAFSRERVDPRLRSKLIYLPSDFHAARLIQPLEKSGQKPHSDQVQFLLTLRHPTLKLNIITDLSANEADRQQRIHYANYLMENDLYCVLGMDTVKSEYVHFERTYGHSPENRFIVGFPAFDVSQDFEIHFNPSIPMGESVDKIYVYDFKNNTFSNLPKLKK